MLPYEPQAGLQDAADRRTLHACTMIVLRHGLRNTFSGRTVIFFFGPSIMTDMFFVSYYQTIPIFLNLTTMPNPQPEPGHIPSPPQPTRRTRDSGSTRAQ